VRERVQYVSFSLCPFNNLEVIGAEVLKEVGLFSYFRTLLEDLEDIK
jgi:hypothetical protein